MKAKKYDQVIVNYEYKRSVSKLTRLRTSNWVELIILDQKIMP
jgi:hypothetical protein